MWRPKILIQIAVVAGVLLIAGFIAHKKFYNKSLANVPKDTFGFFKEPSDNKLSKELIVKEEVMSEPKDDPKKPAKPRIKVDNSGTYQLKLEGMNTKERSEFQQKQVDKFCKLYNLNDRNMENYKNVDYHLIVNTKAKALYCYAPKVGCTNLKIAFLMSQGKLNQGLVDVAPHTLVPDPKIRKIVNSNNFGSVKGSNRTKYIEEFFKFVMYRHPLERLVSAYRDKVQRGVPEYGGFRAKIFKYNHPNENPPKEAGAQITFSEFVTYWLNNHIGDEHFVTIFDLCQPCRVRYSYYGQFKTFRRHAAVLLDRIDAKSKFLLEDYYVDQNKRTKFITQELYDEVSDEDKRKVLKKLSQDIDFYYHIYPDEVDTHKEILNLPDELIVPY